MFSNWIVVGVAGIEPTMAVSNTLTPIWITPVGFEPTNVRVKAASVSASPRGIRRSPVNFIDINPDVTIHSVRIRFINPIMAVQWNLTNMNCDF